MKKTKNGLAILNQEQVLKVLNAKPKGITLLGNVGIGKSWLFEQVFFNVKSPDKQFHDPKPPMYTANDVASIYASGGMEAILDKFRYQLQGRQSLVIDDIGTELILANYGVKVDIVEWLILECYSAGAPIFTTTNLTLDALTKRYGSRVIDRLKEKTFFIVLEGDSYREASYKNSDTELETILT
tara:strand:+ start:1267 stop:1818 length:552 start_codon:yes stop_codon:yes gene_type:complete